MCSNDAVVRVRDISKHYLIYNRPEDRMKQMIVPRIQRLLGRPPTHYCHDFAALNSISFDLKRGETVGIIGRNGCGKSTILQIVCGTLQPTTGTVEVNGRIAALLELGAGFNPEFTGRENVYLNGAILGRARSEIDSRFDDIAGFADIGMFIDQPVKTYSSGMYVRLAFAVAINVDPDILVVDEALSAGDEAFRRKCFARIEEIKDQGSTILFVSHSAQTIVQLCDSAMLFDRGDMILEGRPKTVVSQYQRLVNLSRDQAEPVREAIKAMDGWAEGRKAAGSESLARADPSGTAPASVPPDQVEIDDESWFDPGLVSRSLVDYESQGARIRDVRIEDRRGQRVNILVSGKSYEIVYELRFERDAKAAAFGVGVKTVSGFQVAGATTRSHSALKSLGVSAGEELCVQLEFECLLNQGTYFINCGVRAVVEDGDIYLHRILDAYTFRVVTQHESIATDVVDLNFRASVTTLADPGVAPATGATALPDSK